MVLKTKMAGEPGTMSSAGHPLISIRPGFRLCPEVTKVGGVVFVQHRLVADRVTEVLEK